MKRFISFILLTVLSAVLSIHNPVMAFWDVVKKSVWESYQTESMIMNCHEEESNDKDDICCYDKDYWFSSVSNIQSHDNKKKFDKIKYSFIDISFETFSIYEWNLIWNISPPYKEESLQKSNYVSLIWIIKSNT